MRTWTLLLGAALLLGLTRCGVYTPYGAQTNGARTFSVSYFTPVALGGAPRSANSSPRP